MIDPVDLVDHQVRDDIAVGAIGVLEPGLGS
jgi:hypothetical protein